MNGKVLKVVEYDLTFGKDARMVNVFSVFRFRKNNGLYVIYADVDTQYNVVNYGGSHIKGNTVLSIGGKPNDDEIIKEYIFKIINGEKLDDFEVISLDSIEGIEIISSNHLELKTDVIQQLIDKTIPKKEVIEEEVKKPVKKKKKGKLLIILLLLIAIGGGAYYFLPNYLSNNDKVSKVVDCTLTSSNQSLNASVEEKRTLNFDYKDVLKSIDTTIIFHFNSEKDYEDFINRGTMYKYMPEDETKGGFKQDAGNNIFTIMKKEEVDSNYTNAVNYEEVILENKREGYTCEEKVLGEQYGEFLYIIWRRQGLSKV